MRRQYASARAEINALRQELVDDSIDRAKVMTRLLTLVREQERADTMGRLADARSRAQNTDR